LTTNGRRARAISIVVEKQFDPGRVQTRLLRDVGKPP
jgi:hypothetical protein